jgi:AraC family transcriptional regulator
MFSQRIVLPLSRCLSQGDVMHIDSQVREEAEMRGCAPRSDEDRLGSRAGTWLASAGTPQGQARSREGSLTSIGNIVARPSVEITPAESIKRLGTGWRAWFSESVLVPLGSRIEFRFKGSSHLLVAYNEGMRKSGETSIDGLHSSSLRTFIRKLTFVPAGCSYREWHEAGAATRVTFLYLDPTVFRRTNGGENGFPPRLYFEDSLVWETAAKLKNAIESGQAKCMSYLEALSGVLAHELARVDNEIARAPAVRRGGLAGWQKRAVVDYIEQHLGEQVCLLRLAKLCRLSVHHFCRAFKQSFGMPPHQYQVQRRMEAAKLLLADRATSVTEIALILGYAQTSSFSSAFRKTTGWAPSVYRREFR